jgi:1,4-alpha-glucan branching enzyme
VVYGKGPLLANLGLLLAYLWLHPGKKLLFMGHMLGAPRAGYWREVFNSNSQHYAGSNLSNGAEAIGAHGRSPSLRIVLPPLRPVVFEPRD